jgi:hypothetical protein
MRYQGYDVSDIAHALNLSESAVTSRIDKAAASAADDLRATVVREAELLKLEEMEPPFLSAATDGDSKAALVVLKLMERRSALLGVDRQPSMQQQGNTYNLVTILSNMSRPQSPISRVAEDA